MRSWWMAGMLAAMAVGPAQARRLELVGEAERFLPATLAGEARELQASVNALTPAVLLGCEDCPGPFGTDIFMSVRRGEGWTPPGRAAFSRPQGESLPSFSSDGYWVYYVSDRPGGFGDRDLYRIYFMVRRLGFGTPENLGASINSAGEEGGASAGARGDVVYFASRGREGAKGWDLFVSRRSKGVMTPGERLPTIDTGADEFDPGLLADDAGLVFARAQKLGESRSTLWFAPRQGEGFGKPVELGPAVNAPGSSVRGAQQDWSSPGHLLFTRDGDIWRIGYRIVD